MHISGQYFSVHISNILKLPQSIILFSDKATTPGDDNAKLIGNFKSHYARLYNWQFVPDIQKAWVLTYNWAQWRTRFISIDLMWPVSSWRYAVYHIHMIFDGLRHDDVIKEFPSQKPVTRSFDVFFDLCLNKRWRKQSWGRWFETPSHSLWRHCNANHLQLSKPGHWKIQMAPVFLKWLFTLKTNSWLTRPLVTPYIVFD